MDYRCPCPNTAPLTTIPDSDCIQTMKQILRVAFVKKGKVIWATDDGSGTGTTGVPIANMDLVTNGDWTARLNATDDTKIVITPMLYGSTIVPGEPIEYGSGNEVPFAIPINVGTGPTTFNSFFRGLTSEQERALKSLSCYTELEAYFFNEAGEIIYTKDENGKIKGFDIYSLSTNDLINDGKDTLDGNGFKFYMTSGWSSYRAMKRPISWNPLTL